MEDNGAGRRPSVKISGETLKKKDIDVIPAEKWYMVFLTWGFWVPFLKVVAFYTCGYFFCKWLVFLVFLLLNYYLDHTYEGWDVKDVIYFTTVTISTVGYGDVHPTKNETRLFTVFYIIIGLFGVFTVITDFAASTVAPTAIDFPCYHLYIFQFLQRLLSTQSGRRGNASTKWILLKNM